MADQNRSSVSFRRKPEESMAEYGQVGFGNWWGGFHRTTDSWAYVTLGKWMTRHLFTPFHARAALRMMRDRWRHRRCDTVDFHHYACTLDPFGKRLEADYWWEKNWRDHPSAVAARAQQNEPSQ